MRRVERHGYNRGLRHTDQDELRPASFPEEVERELRRQYGKLAIRYAIAFTVLFVCGYAAIWWSGATVHFASARTAMRAAPTWTVAGIVRNAATHAPVAWAIIADDPGGLPPLFRAEANLHGAFELLTIAEPHRVRITAAGYRGTTIAVGRRWFLWMPRGGERRDVELTPEQ